jgi:hypothetical protein
MSFAGKCMELEIVMLSEISQDQRPNITCSHSFAEPRPKVIIMMMVIKIIIIMGHECVWGTVKRAPVGWKSEKEKGPER